MSNLLKVAMIDIILSLHRKRGFAGSAFVFGFLALQPVGWGDTITTSDAGVHNGVPRIPVSPESLMVSPESGTSLTAAILYGVRGSPAHGERPGFGTHGSSRRPATEGEPNGERCDRLALCGILKTLIVDREN